MIDDRKKGSRRIKVKVFPKSGRSEVEGYRNGVLIVRLNSAPDKGKANKELIDVLNEYYGVGKGSIEIVSGDKSRRKIVAIHDGLS
jgi:uncharacterized protein